MSRETLQPPGWARPRGYANGIAAEGRQVFVAGQIGWDAEQKIVSDDFAMQTRQALSNIIDVLACAGAGPSNIVRLTWYVTSRDEYNGALAEIGTSAPLGLGRLQVRLPSPGLAITQIVLTLTDIVLAGACLYVLLDSPEVPFLGFLVVYTLATVAGMVSHVPGGIGVFEGILLVTFHSLIPTESLAAALLVYRAIYNLLPLAIATVLLMGRETWERTRA